MVLSRCPYPPGRERATLSRCLISSEVRYSRGRMAALVGRRSVIVRFSVVGPLLRFIRNPLFFIGEVYPIVRISVKNGLSHLRWSGLTGGRTFFLAPVGGCDGARWVPDGRAGPILAGAGCSMLPAAVPT